MTKTATSAYKAALLKTVRQPTLLLTRLRMHWPGLEQKILEQRRKLTSEIPDDDPIRLSVDLLTPLFRISNETTHTRAIAYLLDPRQPHGFDKSILAAVLAKLPRGTGASQLVALLRQKRTHVEVLPEYAYQIKKAGSRSAARNDIRIEVRNPRKTALIVIENKIDALEGKGQLDRYEAEALKWCKKNKGQSLLVYLARKRRRRDGVGDQWVGLSYLDLASALRDVWRSRSSTPGGEWLKLYIAAITRGVLSIDIGRLQDTTIAELKEYLGRAPT